MATASDLPVIVDRTIMLPLTPVECVLSPPLSLFGKGDVAVKTTVGVSFSLELAAAVEAERCFLTVVRPPPLDFRR